MQGTVAITDHGWYEFLLAQGRLDEVNFWTPSAHWGFRGEVGSPFFFKLKAPHNKIGGFGIFARYEPATPRLAWDAFGLKNGKHQLRLVVLGETYPGSTGTEVSLDDLVVFK